MAMISASIRVQSTYPRGEKAKPRTNTKAKGKRKKAKISAQLFALCLLTFALVAVETPLQSHQRFAFDVPEEAVHAGGSGEDDGVAGGEGEADEIVSGDSQRRGRVAGEADDAALALERGGAVEVPFGVEGEALGTSESAVESGDGSVQVNAVDGVEAGSRGAGDEEVAVGSERQVIGGDTRLESGEDKNLAVAGNLEDGAAAIADVEVLVLVKGDAGGDAHALGVGRHGAVGRDLVHRPVVARGDVQLSGTIEGDGGGVHHLAEERTHGVVGLDAVDGDGNLLPARAGERGIDVAKRVDGGIGDGMKILGERRSE